MIKLKTHYLGANLLYHLENYKKKAKVFCRNATLVPKALNKNFVVYNGSKFINVMVSEEIIGHKLGEFCQTRARYYYKRKQIKKKKK